MNFSVEKLQKERIQLINHWKKVSERMNYGRQYHQIKMITEAQNGELEFKMAKKLIGSQMRAFHDYLGYKAKGLLIHGGLCAGALYRTKKFIDTECRSGSKKDQSVHIEHTIPINVLATEIMSYKFEYEEALSWLLKNSVTTAMNICEKSYLGGVNHKSEVFENKSLNYGKPFMRYGRIFSDPENTVFDVFNGVEVDPESTTVDSNFESVIHLLHVTGLSSENLNALEKSIG